MNGANGDPDPDPDIPTGVPVQRATAIPTGTPVQAAQPFTQTGWATNFASPRDLQIYQRLKALGKSEPYALARGDNGIGSPALGSISTPNAYGVAVPTSFLRKQFGNDPAAWRSARAQLTYGGQTVQVPFVDVGPSGGQQKKGVVTDLTYPLSQALGTGDMSKVQISYLPNAGTDYTKDPTLWYNEQSQIHQKLTGQMGLPGGTTPSPTPMTLPTGIGGKFGALGPQSVGPAIAQMGGYSQQLGPPKPAQPVAPAIAQMGGYSPQPVPQRVGPAIPMMGGYGPANQPPPPAAPGLPPWGYGAPPPWGQPPG
jgi:hypothetical protein